jgi:hypothetical protein
MKTGRDMGLMSQIETNLDDPSRQTNKGWMNDFYLRYNQRNFLLICGETDCAAYVLLLCAWLSRFSRPMGLLFRDGVCRFSPLYAGMETD